MDNNESLEMNNQTIEKNNTSVVEETIPKKKNNKFLIIVLIVIILGIIAALVVPSMLNKKEEKNDKEETKEEKKEEKKEETSFNVGIDETSGYYWLSKENDSSDYIKINSADQANIQFSWIHSGEYIGDMYYTVSTNNDVFEFEASDGTNKANCSLAYKDGLFTISVLDDNYPNLSKGDYIYQYKYNEDEFQQVLELESKKDSNVAYDFSEEVNCTNKKDISIYDIFHTDETEEGISYTEQYLVPGTYTIKQLDDDVTSYFLSNSQYTCEYIKYNKDAKASSTEGTLLASISEGDMKKSIEKLYGTGNYKRPQYGLLLGSANGACNGFDFNSKNNNYELRVIGGCGGASSSIIKVINKSITTNGDNTIVTEHIDYQFGYEKDNIKKTKLKVEYTVRTKDKVLIKIVTTKE